MKAHVRDAWLTDLLKPFDAASVQDVFLSSEAALLIQRLADESARA